MAIYHFTIKNDKKPSTGKKISAIEHVEYINREGKYENEDLKQVNRIFTTERKDLLNGQVATIYKSPYGSITNTPDGLVVEKNPSDDTILLALTMAKKSMGEEIIVNGSKKFQARCAKVAAEAELNVRFYSRILEQIKKETKEQIRNERRKFEDNGGKYKTAAHIFQPYPHETCGKRIHTLATGRGWTHVPSLPKRSMDGPRSDDTRELLHADASHELADGRREYDPNVRWSLSRGRRRGAEKIAKRILKNVEMEMDNIYAASHVEYINREKAFTKRGGCIYKSHRLPSWAKDSPVKFFQAADRYTRKGGRRYKEIEFALPNELSLEQDVELIERFIEKNLPNNYYTYAIHDKIGAMTDGTHNTHVHLTFSPRLIDDVEKEKERNRSVFFSAPLRKDAKDQSKETRRKNGAPVDRKWSERSFFPQVRASFADITNEILQKYGFHAQVDHRSLKAQRQEALANGDTFLATLLDRIPEEHINPTSFLEEKNPEVERIKKYRGLKRKYQNLLYESEMLTKKHQNTQIESENRDMEKEINGIIESQQFVDSDNDTNSLIGILRKEFLDALDDYEKAKQKIVSPKEAEEMAMLEYMSEDEREIWAYAKETKTEMEHWDQFLKEHHAPPMEETDAFEAWQELLPAINQKQESLSKRFNEYDKGVKNIRTELNTPEKKEKIQILTHRILQGNRHDYMEYLKASQALDNAMESFDQALFDEEAHEEAQESFTTKELYDISRRRFFGLKKESERLQRQMEAAKKKYYSMERVTEMAQARYIDKIFGKETSRNLHQRERKWQKRETYWKNDIEKYQKEKASFDALPPPSMGNQLAYISKRDDLITEYLKLNETKKSLDEERAAIDHTHHEIQETLNTKDAEEAIQAIALGILKKNTPYRNRYEAIRTKYKSVCARRDVAGKRMQAMKVAIKADANNKTHYRIASGASSSSGAYTPKTDRIMDAITGVEAVRANVQIRKDDDDSLKNWTLMTNAEKEEEAAKNLQQYI